MESDVDGSNNICNGYCTQDEKGELQQRLAWGLNAAHGPVVRTWNVLGRPRFTIVALRGSTYVPTSPGPGGTAGKGEFLSSWPQVHRYKGYSVNWTKSVAIILRT
jgi:hypothetical protein